MLLGRDKIDAAVSASLGGESPALQAEGELTRGKDLGRPGLFVLAGDRVLFVTEPVLGDPEVLAWGAREAPCTLAGGFIGPELRWAFEGGTLRVGGLGLRALDQAHQKLLGEALSEAPSSFASWRQLGAGVSTEPGVWQDRLGSGVSTPPAAWNDRMGPRTSEGAPTAGEADDSEPARAEKKSKAQRRAEARAAMEARQGGAASSGSALARGAASGTSIAARRGRTDKERPRDEITRAGESRAVVPAKGGKPLAKVIGTLVAMGVAAIAGVIAGEVLADDAVGSGQGLADTLALYDNIGSFIGSITAPFLFYFVGAFIVLLASAKGRTMYSRKLFRYNVLALLVLCFGTTLVSSAGDKIRPVVAQQAAGQPPGGQGEQAQPGEPAQPEQQAPPEQQAQPEAPAGQGGETQQAGDGVVPEETLDVLRSALVQVLERRAKAIEKCVEKSPKLPKYFEYTVHAQPTGEIAGVSVRPPVKAPNLEKCLTRLFKAERLPEYNGNPVDIFVPFGEEQH